MGRHAVMRHGPPGVIPGRGLGKPDVSGYRWRARVFLHYKNAVVIRRPGGQVLAVDHFDLRRLPSGHGKSFRVIAYGTLLILIKENPEGFAALGRSIETAAQGSGRMVTHPLFTWDHAAIGPQALGHPIR